MWNKTDGQHMPQCITILSVLPVSFIKSSFWKVKPILYSSWGTQGTGGSKKWRVKTEPPYTIYRRLFGEIQNTSRTVKDSITVHSLCSKPKLTSRPDTTRQSCGVILTHLLILWLLKDCLLATMYEGYQYDKVQKVTTHFYPSYTKQKQMSLVTTQWEWIVFFYIKILNTQ